MTAQGFGFDRFILDPGERLLSRDGEPIDLAGRYLDALTLLVREQGRLVSKERFLEEVWRNVPVTDEALTQCMRTLRRQLGDDAARPRFIETVPKHGYRFIAEVTALEQAGRRDPTPVPASARSEALSVALAGTAGGALAGTVGGLAYGFLAAASASTAAGLSTVLVLICVTTLVALVGAAGVAGGIAASGPVSKRSAPWSVAGGALGGLVVGGMVKLLGLDAFDLLLGRTPGDITGPFEGIMLGVATGLAAVLASGSPSLRRSVGAAVLCGAAAGGLIVVLGGTLMGGSLHLLAQAFPASRIRLDGVGALLGEQGFGPISQLVTAMLEGALFCGLIVGAMLLIGRKRPAAR